MSTKTSSRPWADVRRERSKLSPAERSAIDAEVASESAKLQFVTQLDQLRRARAYSQNQIAEQLGTNQGAVSRIEQQSDLYVGTLRRFAQAMGGTLRSTAKFTDAPAIEIDLFSDLAERASRPSR